MLKNLLNRKQGFTIVEVMIVLAIAGLIILIVFLAVPALQRNSRNQQRNNDVSLIGAAMNECLNNRNGQVSSCGTGTAGQGLLQFLDIGRLNQMETVTVNTSGGGTGSLTAAVIRTGHTCNANGDGSAAGGGARALAIVFQTEGASSNINRCQEV